jgi:hypothetical protein
VNKSLTIAFQQIKKQKTGCIAGVVAALTHNEKQDTQSMQSLGATGPLIIKKKLQHKLLLGGLRPSTKR